VESKFVVATAGDPIRTGLDVGTVWTDTETKESLRLREIGRYPIRDDEGGDDEYPYIVLFDDASEDLSMAPDPQWGLLCDYEADIRAAGAGPPG